MRSPSSHSPLPPPTLQIIIDVPLAWKLLWEGFGWPLRAFAEFRNGALLEDDKVGGIAAMGGSHLHPLPSFPSFTRDPRSDPVRPVCAAEHHRLPPVSWPPRHSADSGDVTASAPPARSSRSGGSSSSSTCIMMRPWEEAQGTRSQRGAWRGCRSAAVGRAAAQLVRLPARPLAGRRLCHFVTLCPSEKSNPPQTKFTQQVCNP